jgi:hypothetical protein
MEKIPLHASLFSAANSSSDFKRRGLRGQCVWARLAFRLSVPETGFDAESGCGFTGALLNVIFGEYRDQTMVSRPKLSTRIFKEMVLFNEKLLRR